MVRRITWAWTKPVSCLVWFQVRRDRRGFGAMVTYTDITQQVLSQTNIPVVVNKFRDKARAYSLIRDASLTIAKIEGASLPAGQFLFQTLGEVRISAVSLAELVLKFSASAEYKAAEGRVYLTSFKVLNGLAPIANALIEATGISIGRSLHVSEHDAEVIKVALLEQAV